MSTRLISAIALLMLLAAVFGTVGFAYSASVDNTNNTVGAEYVVLSQQNYTFSTDLFRFDIVTSEGGTQYQVRNVTELIPIEGAIYYGFQIGDSDILRATVVGTWDGKVTVSTAILDDSWFVDYSNSPLDWRYILKIEGNGTVQYAYYDGSNDSDPEFWKIVVETDTPGTYEEVENLTLVEDVDYTTTLYFAGPGSVINDGSVFRSAGKTYKPTTAVEVKPTWMIVKSSDDYECKFQSLSNSADSNYESWSTWVTAGSDLVLPKNTFAISGKVFVGWYDETLQKVYYPGYAVKGVDQPHTLVAQWEDSSGSEYKTVTIYANGNNGTMAPEYVRNGETYIMPMKEFSSSDDNSKRFVGWSLLQNPGQNDRIYRPGESLSVSNNITLYPQWSDIVIGYKIVKLTGYIGSTLYTYLNYTDSNGTYTMPNNFFYSSMLPGGGNIDWMFKGWSIRKIDETKTGTVLAVSDTMPNGIDDVIINNGTIKFMYRSSEQN